MNRSYKNIIFTKHAFERLKDRSLSKDIVFKTINRPDHKKSSGDESVKFIRTINNRKVHAVATYLRDEKKWLVISNWVRGEEDKKPFIWLIITLPFKILLILLKFIFKKR